MGSKIVVMMMGATLLAGCASSLGQTSAFCDPASGINPIRLTATERAALAPGVKRDILAVNLWGERNCGWKP